MIRVIGYVDIILLTIFIIFHVYCLPKENTVVGPLQESNASETKKVKKAMNPR